MDWGHAPALGLLLTLATCWSLRGPLLCRLGFHARPRFSSSARWVCRRCPAAQGLQVSTPATERTAADWRRP